MELLKYEYGELIEFKDYELLQLLEYSKIIYKKINLIIYNNEIYYFLNYKNYFIDVTLLSGQFNRKNIIKIVDNIFCSFFIIPYFNIK